MPPATRTLVLLDAASLNRSADKINLEIDFARLYAYLQTQHNLLRAIYYVTVPSSDGDVSSRPFLARLHDIGYQVVTKPGEKRTGAIGNVNPEITVDAMEQTERGRVSKLLLFSGSGDLRRVVEVIQRRDVEVTVITTQTTVANELRRQADRFIDLADIRSQIEKRR